MCENTERTQQTNKLTNLQTKRFGFNKLHTYNQKLKYYVE